MTTGASNMVLKYHFIVFIIVSLSLPLMESGKQGGAGNVFGRCSSVSRFAHPAISNGLDNACTNIPIMPPLV